MDEGPIGVVPSPEFFVFFSLDGGVRHGSATHQPFFCFFVLIPVNHRTEKNPWVLEVHCFWSFFSRSPPQKYFGILKKVETNRKLGGNFPGRELVVIFAQNPFCLQKREPISPKVSCRVLTGPGVSKGRGCSWGTPRIREDWGTLWKIRGSTTPPKQNPIS